MTRAIRYGTHHAQVADLWLPTDPAGPLPVVALLHGGFWRQIYTKRLMHGLARAITAQGWAVFNIEYRRVGALGSGGWPATFDDVSAALDALAGVEGVDLERVVTCGHSAGGHLALWLGGARRTEADAAPAAVRPRAAISLAGVVDLTSAARQGVGAGAVEDLMGGTPDQHPARYKLGSPSALLPLGIPQVLLHGADDTTVPPSLSEVYAAQAVALGDDARYVPLAGVSHMDMIRPRGAAFDALIQSLTRFR